MRGSASQLTVHVSLWSGPDFHRGERLRAWHQKLNRCVLMLCSLIMEELQCCGYTMFWEQIWTKPKSGFDAIGAIGWQCSIERTFGWGRHDEVKDEEERKTPKHDRVHAGGGSLLKTWFAKNIESVWLFRLSWGGCFAISISRFLTRFRTVLYQVVSHAYGHMFTRMNSDCSSFWKTCPRLSQQGSSQRVANALNRTKRISHGILRQHCVPVGTFFLAQV